MEQKSNKFCNGHCCFAKLRSLAPSIEEDFNYFKTLIHFKTLIDFKTLIHKTFKKAFDNFFF